MFYIALNSRRVAGKSPASFFKGIFIASVFFIQACSSDDDPEKGKHIASVYDKHLYENELLAAIPEGMNETDSAEFVKNYVDTWIRENILLHEAEEKLADRTDEIADRLEAYRRSLMIYEYEQWFLRENLDTLITDSEIEKYYQKNQKDFELKDYIIKCVYVKLEKENSSTDKVVRWIQSGKKEDLLALDEFCRNQAISYYHDRDNWIFLNDILRDVPLETPNKESFLKNNKLVHFSDEEFTYVLQILDYRLKDETSPLSLEKDNIKARILQSRMNESIKSMRNKAVKNAYDNDEVEIHDEK